MVSVMLYPCMFCVALSMDLLVLCVACLTVFGETIRNMVVVEWCLALWLVCLCLVFCGLSCW